MHLHWYSWQILMTAFFLATLVTWLIWKPHLGLTAMENKLIKSYGQTFMKFSYVAVSLISFGLGFAIGDIKRVYKNDTYDGGYSAREKEQLVKNDTFHAGYQARELEQFKNTFDENNLLVISVFQNTARLQKIDREHGPVGQIFSLKFCNKPGMYWPKLEAGNVIEQIKYEERGECESVSDKKLGVIIKRDKKNTPVIDRSLLARALTVSMKGGD